MPPCVTAKEGGTESRFVGEAGYGGEDIRDFQAAPEEEDGGREGGRGGRTQTGAALEGTR